MRFALRNLANTPGFTALVILTLALGIGTSTAIFVVVDTVVLRPLDYPQPDRLARITSELRGFGATDTGVLAAELFDYQARAELFANVAGVLPISANVTSSGSPERLEMLLVSWNYFDVLGVRPAHGRTFSPDDDTPGVANIAVVSDSFWRRRLGADPRAVGRTILIDEDPILVVGVMPPGFGHPGRAAQAAVDVWSPAGFRNPGGQRSRRRLEGALVRLQSGVTFERASARLADIGVEIARQFPADYPSANGWAPRLVPLHGDVVSGVATPMFVLLSGVGLLLLIACVNVAHLVLARGAGRQPEIAIRKALGASAGRLLGQLATESAMLAAAAGALGVLVASWSLRGLLALSPGRVPRVEDVALDARAVAIAAAISLVVMVVFALVPAWQMRRTDTFAALKDGGAGRGSDRRGARARGMLVAAEVAMATVLLIGAGLLVRTVVGLLNTPVGFDTRRLMTARVTLPRPNDPARAEFLDPARRVAFAREALERIARLPGIERVAMTNQIPMGGFNPPLFVEVEGRATTGAAPQPVMHNFLVSSGYFDTMGIRLVRGRAFSDADRDGAERVAIVSEAAARLYWRDGDALGGRLRVAPDAPWLTVVGIAGDVLNRRLTESPQPLLYRPLEQASDLSLAVLVRTSRDVPDLGETLAREIRAIDPDLPLHAVRTMESLIEQAVSQRRFVMRVLLVFGTLATALALLGIYGVMAYSVAQRTREIGIRMALGARQSDVSRLVLRQGVLMTCAGIVIGVAASVALSRWLESQLYGVRPSDPWTVGSALVTMLIVAAAAAYLPARRAARVDPINALRTS